MRCFHCNEPVPAGTDFTLDVHGVRRSMCCPGCVAVAELIEAQGLDRFYHFRSAPAIKPRDRNASERFWAVCDRPEVERRITRAVDTHRKDFPCHIAGVNCAACAWLIDRGLRTIDGIEEVSVNPVTGDATIRFDGTKLKPGAILAAIARFGFEPRPALAGVGNPARAQAARNELKRLAVAGLGFAQVMTLSAALYLGAFKSMQAEFETFFVLVSLLVATPVVLYSGAPIFRSAWLALSQRRLGMDVPVSLAILLALGASLVNAFRDTGGTGHVYFDSATMFVFFLTLGRFFESRARHKAGNLFTALGELTPIAANRKRGAAVEQVGTIELAVGDRVIVAPGEAVPADGDLLSEQGMFDESLLSGESLGRARARGDAILGGSINVGRAPIEMTVTRVGADSYIERVGDILQRAMADRPEFLSLADTWAGWFIAAILLLTIVTGSLWLAVAPERAFETVLAMLVVTCPCALSLAAPTAYAVALGSLARRGLLLQSTRALERLGDVKLWLFDKTGTLTEGRIAIADVKAFSNHDADECLRIAATLEAGIEHPIARALQRAEPLPAASDVELEPGYGISGIVADQRYRVGSGRYVGANESTRTVERSVYVASDKEILARIELTDSLRPHAREAIDTLTGGGADAAIVSGDSQHAVAAAAQRLGIRAFFSDHDPGQKLALLQREQGRGTVVAAVGDGINDAPLLARADVSVAMVAGSQLARASADVVFTGNDLRVLARLPEWAQITRHIVRQNLGWAALYNLAAVPLAALGYLAPWMAAIGMSVSSLLVVGNALRLSSLLTESRSERSDHALLARLARQEAP
jgi:Cu2+-exporting ATPase